MFTKALPCDPARYIPTFEAFSEHDRHPLGVSTLSLSHTFWAFHTLGVFTSPEHIFKTALFER